MHNNHSLKRILKLIEQIKEGRKLYVPWNFLDNQTSDKLSGFLIWEHPNRQLDIEDRLHLLFFKSKLDINYIWTDHKDAIQF